MQPRSLASLGIDVASMTGHAIWLATIVYPAGEGGEFVRARGMETRGDLGQTATHVYADRTQVAGGAKDLRVAWSLTPRADEPWAWHAWVEGSTVRGWFRPKTGTVITELSTTVVAQVGPPLSDGKGACSAFFLVDTAPAQRKNEPGPGTGCDIVQVLFDASELDKPATSQVVLRLSRTEVPLACVAGQGMVGDNRTVRMLIAEKHDQGTRVEIFELSRERPPQAIGEAMIAGMTVMKGVEPAIRIDADGSTVAAMIATDGANERSVRVVDVTFGPGNTENPAVVIGDARELPAGVCSGAVGFQSRPNARPARHWALLLEDGTIAHNVSSNEIYRPAHKPVVPVQIAVMSQATYLLTLDGESPSLEAIH